MRGLKRGRALEQLRGLAVQRNAAAMRLASARIRRAHQPLLGLRRTSLTTRAPAGLFRQFLRAPSTLAMVLRALAGHTWTVPPERTTHQGHRDHARPGALTRGDPGERRIPVRSVTPSRRTAELAQPVRQQAESLRSTPLPPE